jgi:CubicO group peptidase (beta-lactamase class C family)
MITRHAAVSILIVLLLFSASSCHVGRYFYFNYADINDHRKFASVPIEKSDRIFYFHQPDKSHIYLSDSSISNITGHRSLDKFLESSQTVAFIIIRNDTIVMEKYFYGYERSSIVPVFSVAKSFVSALTGIALDKEYINSIDDTIGQYLPELSGKGFENLKLSDLIDMRSGIQFQESYKSPFSDMAKFYYGTNLNKYVENLIPKSAPGLEYEYVSVNTLLISTAIERSSGQSIAVFLEENLWHPLGMEFDASWSIDSRKGQTVKSFCCLNTTAIDLARFARLYIHHGNLNGNQIVNASWISQTMTIRNNSIDSQGYPYGMHWRITEEGAIFAKGILGQYIYIDPLRKVSIIRLGKSPVDTDWPEFFEELGKKL